MYANKMKSKSSSVDCIAIKAKANRHGYFLLLLGCCLLALVLILSQFYWQQARLVLIFLILCSFIVIITGLFKRSEPKFSIHLTPDNIHYHHRYGHWQLTWQQIQTINIVKELSGLTTVALPYIGFKLKNIECLAEQVSPRLANRLIHEQRPLLTFCVMHRLLTIEQTQLDFTPFKLRSGQLIKGPLAGFLHHCQTLELALGYHLYIPDSSIDREIEDFCQLLQHCKTAEKHYR